MNLFAAGAELDELEASLRLGVCAGVVVDRGAPALASAQTARGLVIALGKLVDGPVFVDVSGAAGAADAAAVAGSARELAAGARSMVARVAFGEAGLATIRACAAVGVATQAVGCPTPVEAVAAARAGARWVSPAWDLPDGPARGAMLGGLAKIAGALASFGVPTQVLAGPAGDRSALVDLALAGAHAASASAAAVREIARRRAEGLGGGPEQGT
jgi:transaldolase